MKLKITILSVALIALAACSDGGSSGGNGILPPDRVKPNDVPPNPAPDSYVQEILLDMNEAPKYVPSNEAFMGAVIDGNDIKIISNWSQERQEALNKLSTSGRRFVDDIKRDCKIDNATLTKTGDLNRDKAESRVLKLSTSGTQCPYVTSENITENSSYTQDQAGQKIRFNQTKSQTQKVLINNDQIASLAGYKQTEFNLDMVTVADMTYQNTGTIKVTATGNGRLVRSNGDIISGPVSMILNQTLGTASSSADMSLLFEGTSKAGAIRVLVKQEPNQKTPSIYLNGKKVELEEWTSIGTTLQSKLAL